MSVRSGLEWLALNRVFAWRNNTGAGWLVSDKDKRAGYLGNARWIDFGKVGSGDEIGVTPYGRHFEIEDKQGKGRQNKGQKIHQRKVEEAGGIYLVVRSDEELESARGKLVGDRESIREYIAFLERYMDGLP